MNTGLKVRAAEFLDSDFVYRFKKSPVVVLASIVTLFICLCALFAPLTAPFDPFDPSSLSLMDAFTPPAWTQDGNRQFLLGTDDQGRDILSTIIYGSRISLFVGISAVFVSISIGVTLGLLSGYIGGWVDTVIMRMADIQLTVPGLLIALTIDGIVRASVSSAAREDLAVLVLVFAIGIAEWPQFARLARSGALAERHKDYVAAARIVGRKPAAIIGLHILPNVVGPILILSTIGLALAILSEATLSFLGVGVPPTTPSLGTLIRIGNDYLFSGEWWIIFFPSIALVILVLSVNILGDWLRDVFNPKLR